MRKAIIFISVAAVAALLLWQVDFVTTPSSEPAGASQGGEQARASRSEPPRLPGSPEASDHEDDPANAVAGGYGAGTAEPRRHAPEDEARAARLHAEAKTLRHAGSSATLTREEEKVLELYEAMADVLDQHANDCDAMATAVDALVDERGRDVSALTAARAKLDGSARQASQDRVEQAAEARLRRIRAQLRTSLSECGNNDTLVGALERLAASQG